MAVSSIWVLAQGAEGAPTSSTLELLTKARSLADTFPLPVGGEIVIRMHFIHFTGEYVYHCHILAHEDHGMMGTVLVERPGQSGAPPPHGGHPSRR